jgi:hypothetical protein
VAARVSSTCAVGVVDGGNHTMVGEGAGGSVGVGGMGVAKIVSSIVQETVNAAIRKNIGSLVAYLCISCQISMIVS